MEKTLKQRGCRALLAVGAAATAGALAVGCSSGSGSAGGTANAAGSTQGPIVIGNIGTYSGNNSGNFLGGDGTLKAWADWTNAHGGIGGRQVQLDVLDDGGSASTALKDARELVQQDHVVAIVGELSQDAATWASYVDQAGVPVIGGNPVDPLFTTDKNFFPDGTTGNESILDVVKAAGEPIPKGAFFYCAESPVCSSIIPQYKAAYQSASGSLVNVSSVSVSAPNYTAQCLSAKGAGAENVHVAAPPQTLVTVADNCSQQGYYPYYLTDAVGLTPSLATQLQAVSKGRFIFNADDFPFFEDSTPATKDFQRALQQYAPSVANPKTFNENDATVWAAGQLFAAVVKASGGTDVSAASVLSGLYALKQTTLGGLTPPLSYQKGKPASISCIYVAGIDGSGLTTPRGASPFCP